jgi:hypothetical protein
MKISHGTRLLNQKFRAKYFGQSVYCDTRWIRISSYNRQQPARFSCRYLSYRGGTLAWDYDKNPNITSSHIVNITFDAIPTVNNESSCYRWMSSNGMMTFSICSTSFIWKLSYWQTRFLPKPNYGWQWQGATLGDYKGSAEALLLRYCGQPLNKHREFYCQIVIWIPWENRMESEHVYLSLALFF